MGAVSSKDRDRLRQEVRASLPDAHLPALLTLLAHLTGDLRWLEEPFHHPGPVVMVRAVNPDEAIAPEVLAEVRQAAEDAIVDYLSNGLPADGLNESVVTRLMSGCVGEDVDPAYAPMAMEEMGLRSREVDWRTPPADTPDFLAVIVGAGMSGLLTAVNLQRLGIPYVVLEKNDSVGGTWFENTYPGCRVDVASHFYSYSFEPRSDWPEYYSSHQELRSYFEGVAERHGVWDNIRFQQELVSATFDEPSQRWRLVIRERTGAEYEFEANALITAVGQLNRPKMPAIDGLDRFHGPVFHSAAWRHDVDLTGNRVAVIGTGASSMQFTPEIAKVAGQLTIFQRSPQWSFPNANYRRQVSTGKQWLLEHVPLYAGWYRFYLLWALCDALWPALRVDDDYDGGPSINAKNERTRLFLTAYLKEQLGDREDLLEKSLPAYPPYTKRVLVDNGWFRMLQEDDVELIVDRIDHVDENGIVMQDGRVIDVDVIVCGTGFQATRMLWPMQISGRTGARLAEVWGDDDPRAYLGITVPGFPNLFFLYGPNTNLGHGGSIIFHSECQARYIATCLREMVESDLGTLECRRDVFEDFNQRLDALLDRTIWSVVQQGSWYRNSRGRVAVMSPWRLVDYWNMTKAIAPDDFIVEQRVVPAIA